MEAGETTTTTTTTTKRFQRVRRAPALVAHVRVRLQLPNYCNRVLVDRVASSRARSKLSPVHAN